MTLLTLIKQAADTSVLHSDKPDVGQIAKVLLNNKITPWALGRRKPAAPPIPKVAFFGTDGFGVGSLGSQLSYGSQNLINKTQAANQSKLNMRKFDSLDQYSSQPWYKRFTQSLLDTAGFAVPGGIGAQLGAGIGLEQLKNNTIGGPSVLSLGWDTLKAIPETIYYGTKAHLQNSFLDHNNSRTTF